MYSDKGYLGLQCTFMCPRVFQLEIKQLWEVWLCVNNLHVDVW